MIEEHKAVHKIKKDPKYFYNYAKRLRKYTYSPNILIDKNSNIKSNPIDIANTLQDQFKSVFSIPITENDYTLRPQSVKPKFPLSPDLVLSKNDFLSAIDEMKNDMSSSKFDIPPYIFKTYKDILWIPLYKFWTKSFKTGQIPKSYKNQIIIPKHKKGSKTNPENFRPICITPNPIKIFERIIRKKISTYLELNEILTETQHGFRQNRSCSTQLISYTNSILNNLTKGIETDSIYLDYSKAFDKIDHTILIIKLKLLKIPDTYVKWIECFIRGRTQTVLVNGQLSFPTTVQSGVPQETVLAPTFFNIYINDLPTHIKNCQILSF